MLTDGQVAQFETLGFIVLRGLFSADEMRALSSEFDDVLNEGRGGETFDGVERQTVMPFVERRELLTQMVADDRIFGTLEQLLGPGFWWTGSDGNLYVGDTRWHADRLQDETGQDHIPWDLNSIKTCFYFDPVDADTGCLRLIPGTHREDGAEAFEAIWRTGLDPDDMRYGVSGPELPCAILDSQPGDVVFFSQGMCHASFGGKAGRRMLAMSSLAKPSRDEHVEFLKRVYSRSIWALHPADTWADHDDPKIRGMVQPMIDLGFETTTL
jgi:hypothetical protein